MNRAPATLHDSSHETSAPERATDHLLNDELLTVQDAARFLNVTVSWVYEHSREDAEDRLPFFKLGKYVRFNRADLCEFVDAKRRAGRAPYRRR
jgi:excisionase family DNA binding protein